MFKQHHYKATVKWTGNNGAGTTGYAGYERSHLISITGKPDLAGSSDAPFRGDISKHNPEDLLLASLSSCHMLWYLHLCADAGVVVVEYVDHAEGILSQNADGSGKFTEVTLLPMVTVSSENMLAKAKELHAKAHSFCFIAASVNFPLLHKPQLKVM